MSAFITTLLFWFAWAFVFIGLFWASLLLSAALIRVVTGVNRKDCVPMRERVAKLKREGKL